MKRKKAISLMISAVMVLNSGVSDVYAVTEEPAVPEVLISDNHAYDPIAELEAERAYRDSTRIVQNKLLFTVLDYRAVGAAPVYWTDSNPVCKANGLTGVKLIMETKAAAAEQKSGLTAYEVYYEAQTNAEDVWSVVDVLRKEEGILTAEPDFVWSKADYAAPMEEEIAHETHFPGLNVTDVWADLQANNVTAPGYGTVVAVIDTGVDYTHFDLKDAMWKNPGEIPGNGIDDDGNGYVDDVYGIDLIENDGDPMDDHGHGTHVAGIIAMQPGNGGGVGLAYGAKIMAIKAGQANGQFASTDIAMAIKYAADNGADVINMSFGGAGKSYLVEAALRDAFGTCVLVAAAGNDGKPTADAQITGAYDCFPAAYNYVLGVMATDNNGNVAGFSNWDFIIGENGEYELAAPGVSIYSTLPGDRYASWNGTSMAAPNVAAAAAIIRSRYTNKSKYTSRYIMGQLVSATTKQAIGPARVYPAIYLPDSLSFVPTPALKLYQFYMFDDPTLFDTNNGDGIAQPGEIIDIGISVFNYWGVAKDVIVTVDTDSEGDIANPYVEIIKDTAVLGEIGTFVTGNNGFVYTDDALTGVTKPLRIRIKEGAPNDAFVQLNFTANAKNGMNETDTEIYTVTGEYTITIQNGVAISGVIHEDMTLTADKYWIIQNNVLIPEGVTVTVEPGTQIQFWSADPANPYTDSPDVYIQVEGRFIAEGTEDKPIQMFPGKGFEDKSVVFTSPSVESYLVRPVMDDDYELSYTVLKYVSLINAFAGWGEREFVATIIDHCQLINDLSSDKTIIDFYAKSVSSSLFINYCNSVHQLDRDLVFYDADTCLFQNLGNVDSCTNGRTDYRANHGIMNSTFLQFSDNRKKYSLPNRPTFYYLYPYEDWEGPITPLFKYNALLSNYHLYPVNQIHIIGTGEGHESYDISGNYWGTTNPDLVKIQCYDADWNVSLNDLIQEPILTLESLELETIYPFMTEAYLTDTDGNRIDTVSGSQTVTMHVKFNRDMAQDVQPKVSYGGSEPYTDYMLSGDWVSAREWTSTFTIAPYIDLGRMYIRSKGAVAADDRWLVTGEDCARFFFEISSASAQAMSLQGSGISGACELSWMQDDFDTFAGYNLYRSESYDPNLELSAQPFTRINSSIISEESYLDTDVEQGQDYYYYFTVLDTALNESKASNIILCTPLDEIGPDIVHTPVAIAALGDPIPIKADVSDNVNVASVTLYYRKGGETDWQSAVMRNTTGLTYSSVISAYETAEGTMEYYIAASDGTNTSYYASAISPQVIMIDVEHSYDGGTVTREATCTETGEIVYRCQDCGHEITEEIPALGHYYSAEWTVDIEATCSATGEKSHHCTRCDVKTEVTEIPMADHIWNAGRITKSNSCTEDGNKHFKCLYCDAEKDEVILATGHDYEDTVHAATCTERGFTEHICQNCGERYCSDFTGLAAHEYAETVLSEPTCTTDGVKQLKCKHCGDTKTVIIPAAGHHFTETVMEPMPDSLGYTLHVCEDCGYSYMDSYTEYQAEKPERMPGDANDDGMVDLLDVVLIRRWLAGGWNVSINESNADVDEDGEVTLKDVTIIRRYLAGGYDVKLQ